MRRSATFAELTSDEELADAIMESMPPVPWTDLATRADLARLDAKLGNKFDALDNKIDALGTMFTERLSAEILGLEGRMSLQMALNTRIVVIAMIALVISMTGAMLTFPSIT